MTDLKLEITGAEGKQSCCGKAQERDMTDLKLEITDAEGKQSCYGISESKMPPRLASRINTIFCKPRKLVNAVPGEDHYRITITLDNGTSLSAEFLENAASTAELDLVDRLVEVASTEGAGA